MALFSSEGGSAVFVFGVELGAGFEQELEHLVARFPVDRDVKGSLPDLALNAVGILPLVDEPLRTTEASATHGATERRVSAVMAGTVGSVEWDAVFGEQVERFRQSVTGGVVERVVILNPSTVFQKGLQDRGVATPTGSVDAALGISAILDEQFGDLSKGCRHFGILLSETRGGAVV